MRGVGNVDQLIERVQHMGALVAHVRDVHAVIFTRRPGECDQFLGGRVVVRSVDQRGTNAQRTFPHRLSDKILHPRQLVRSRRAVGVSHLVLAHCARANERGDVGGNPALLHVVEILPQRGPGDVVLDVLLASDHLGAH